MKDYRSDLETNLYAWLLLTLTPGIGIVTILRLVRHFGTVVNIINQDINTLSQFINRPIAKLIVDKASHADVEKSLAWANSEENRYLITLDNENYPKNLATINDPPLVLYLEGNIKLLQRNKFAIVGTRHPTSQGAENAFKFAENLANNQLTIVSGMAAGIDRQAHLGALNTSSSTIGVIGTGIDLTYPLSNKDLFAKVKERGLLLSEFPLQSQPIASNFPRRNRIISGLSLGCLVVESAIDGGSLISADFALEMGREVMAIPGSIHNPVARGCHKLIKSGAKLVETANDVLEELNLQSVVSLKQQDLLIDDPILAAIGFEPIEIDKICLNLKMSFSDICAKLLELELDGQIVNCGDGKYQRIFR